MYVPDRPTEKLKQTSAGNLQDIPTEKLQSISAEKPLELPTEKLQSVSSEKLPDIPTEQLQTSSPSQHKHRYSRRHYLLFIALLILCFTIVISGTIGFTLLNHNSPSSSKEGSTIAKIPTITNHPKPTPTPSPTPIPFDPSVGAILPTHRVVAFYAVPNAAPTGPAYVLNDQMLQDLQTQGAAYTNIDPAHPVQLAIDLVVSVPDSFPGPEGTYSHHVDASTIQAYLTFCQQHNLLLFLDLNFGQANIQDEVNFFLPYLEQYTFVEMAIDPEWMFPRHDGIPGTNLSNVRASDINPVIETIASLPMKYHVPRKILIIHQYRPDGDGVSNPYDPGQAEIADKANLINDDRVDVVIHIDSVGGFPGDHAEKTTQYEQWVKNDIAKYHNFKYGGFKLFYNLEAPTGVMTPQEVLSLDPPPMVVTYGN